MRTNLFKDRITIQRKTSTQTATGQTVIWTPVQNRYGRKIPVDSYARLKYQQLNSEVTHRLIFEGDVSFEMATHRFMHGGHTYTPIEPPLHQERNTVIMVKEND